MSCSTSLQLSSAHKDPKDGWITPEDGWITADEQMERLLSPLVQKINDARKLPLVLGKIVALYAIDPNLIDWRTGLEGICCLPKLLLPLPLNIHEILNRICPTQICNSSKPDGTFYTLGERCTLSLVPRELGTICAFKKAIEAYGKKQYPENENSLQFLCVWDTILYEYGNQPFKTTHWELLTNEVSETRPENLFAEQLALVNSLAQETFREWQIPESSSFLVAYFLKKIAKGESVYPADKPQNKDSFLDSSGLTLSREFGEVNIGIAAVWKF